MTGSSTAATRGAQPWPRSIAVIGAAGTVGSSVAAQLALGGIGERIHLIDVRQNIVVSHVIDLTDALGVLGRDRPQLLAGPPDDGTVDLVVVAASRPEIPGGDRREFLAANAGLLETLAPLVERLAGATGLVLLLSNPVDILAGHLVRRSALRTDQVVGYALNDSARFRAAAARVLGVGASRVGGHVFGEHGDGQVPMFSSLTVDGAPVDLDRGQRETVSVDVFGWFRRWSALESGRSSGWATGVGVRRMVELLATGEPVVATAGTAHLAGYPESFMALQVQRTATGVAALDPVADAAEAEQLRTSAIRIAEAVDALDTGE
ncbi:lactate/malate family dehydrogenase [Leucobacter sp. GX0328]